MGAIGQLVVAGHRDHRETAAPLEGGQGSGHVKGAGHQQHPLPAPPLAELAYGLGFFGGGAGARVQQDLAGFEPQLNRQIPGPNRLWWGWIGCCEAHPGAAGDQQGCFALAHQPQAGEQAIAAFRHFHRPAGRQFGPQPSPQHHHRIGLGYGLWREGGAALLQAPDQLAAGEGHGKQPDQGNAAPRKPARTLSNPSQLQQQAQAQGIEGQGKQLAQQETHQR